MRIGCDLLPSVSLDPLIGVVEEEGDVRFLLSWEYQVVVVSVPYLLTV